MILINKINDLASKQITIKNESSFVNKNVKIQFNLPAGQVVFSNLTKFPKGSIYNTSTNELLLGDLAPNQQVVFNYIVVVTNISNLPISLSADVTGNINDILINDTVTWQIGTSVCETCPPTSGAISDTGMLYCGNVSTNDTPCTSGETTWTIDMDSIVNGTLTSWNDQTGQYCFSYINPAQDIQFQYHIWCEHLGNPIQSSGPATVTIPKVISNFNIFNYTIRVQGENIELVNGLGTVTSTIPICDIVNTCTPITNNDLG